MRPMAMTTKMTRTRRRSNVAIIKYEIADATQFVPKTDYVLISHITNNVKVWGAGFSGALARAFPGVEEEWRKTGAAKPPRLGEVKAHSHPFTRLGLPGWGDRKQSVIITHMCAQDGVGRDKQRVVYTALSECLSTLATTAINFTTTNAKTFAVVLPRVGSGLGGGDWDTIEGLIDTAFADWDGTIYVCIPPKN